MRFVSSLLFLLFSAFATVSMAQQQTESSSYLVPQHILSVKPQGLLFGLNAQLESRLSDRWSVQNEFYYRGWFQDQPTMLAVASNLK